MNSLFLNLFLFLVGLFLLIKGGDWLVTGASSIAKRFGVPTIVIGLTIVAFGTSAPELFINLFASLKGSTEIAYGNILGSNIANTFLILGLSAVFLPIALQKNTVWKEIPFAFLASVALAFLVNDSAIDGRSFSELSRIDGAILLLFFAIFVYYTFGISQVEADRRTIQALSPLKSSLMIMLGIVMLALGGNLIVDSASFIAHFIGISEAVIGLTIVAIATSLPELVTSIIAIKKKESDIGIGNIVGSNIFNILFVLGLTSVISPLPFTPNLNVSLFVAIFAAFLLFIIMFFEKRHIISRMKGVAFVSIYVAYITYTVVIA